MDRGMLKASVSRSDCVLQLDQIIAVALPRRPSGRYEHFADDILGESEWRKADQWRYLSDVLRLVGGTSLIVLERK